MSQLLFPRLLLAVAAFLLAACAHQRSKSNVHVYGGDSPTIKYTDKAESAGGYINTY